MSENKGNDMKTSTNFLSKKIKSFINSKYDGLDENKRDIVDLNLKLFLSGSKNINELYNSFEKEGLMEGIIIPTSRSRSFTPSDTETVENELIEYIRNKIPEISKIVNEDEKD